MPDNKIKSKPALVKALKKNRAGRKVVFTNGCFDILHYGHIKYLEDAKRLGDMLVVGLNSDASVKRIKGGSRPIVKQLDRARTLSAIESVDYIVIFGQDTPEALIKAVRPDILVKGGDWKRSDIVGAESVCSYGGKVVTIPYIKGRSTSGIIEKIKRSVKASGY